jgi:tetratricopeptide (TPR) repeat protein
MLENGTSGRSFRFGFSEQLKPQLLPRTSSRFILAVLMAGLAVLLSIFPGNAHAQSPENSITAYADAIKKSTIAERITAMDHYLTIASGGSLKVDALEFLVWDHLRLGHQTQSAQRAQELIAISPGNPIGLAVLNQNPSSTTQRGTQRGRSQIQIQLTALRSAMNSLDHLNKPEGMLDRNFQILRQQVGIMLTGATGLCYLEIEDYPNARVALQQAVTNDPNNAQWVYGLGLALLNGKNRDQYHGYWYLARASNLTEGTPQGQQIANYARSTYHNDGGKEAGWNRFLASAAALDSPPNAESSTPAPATTTSPANGATSAGASGTSASNSGASASASGSGSPGNTSKNSTGMVASVPATKPSTVSPINKTKTSAGFESTLREPKAPEPASPPVAPPNRPKVIAAPTEAVSLGIMIETSLLTNENREAIIATLKDIVRNMRVNDEACILVFSDQLDFEQDLTADDKLLEEAIGQIHPKPGRALLPGIAFAAGHLKRIGKNSNRVLLVISDGRSAQANADTLMFRSQVSGVRIDCIGLKTGGEMERALLERVAAYSGGKASFAAGPTEFRTAALEMTRTMGISVP